MKKYLIFATALVGLIGLSHAARSTNVITPLNGVTAITQNIDIDMSNYDSGSISLSISTASPSTVTFKDGVRSTGSITVSNLTGLSTSYATNSLTVSSTDNLTGQFLYVNGDSLKEGAFWTLQNTATGTAKNICDALNRRYSAIFISTNAVGSSAIIYSTSVVVGTAGNLYSITTNIPASITTQALFTGGIDNARLMINGYPFNANSNWFPGGTTAATATNLASAINADPYLDILMTAQAVGSVVYATSTYVGISSNFVMASSTPTAISVKSFTNGQDNDFTWSGSNQVDLKNQPFASNSYPLGAGTLNQLNKATTQWGTGLPVLLGVTAGTVHGPLADKATYYAYAVTSSGFKLATTSTGAAVGNGVVITTCTQSGGGSFTLTPIPITGVASLAFQTSNDGVSFYSLYVTTGALTTPFLTTQSIVAAQAAYNFIWDLKNIYYRILRIVYTKPATWGALNMKAVIHGKTN